MAGGRKPERGTLQEDKDQTEERRTTSGNDWKRFFEERSAEFDRRFEARLKE